MISSIVGVKLIGCHTCIGFFCVGSSMRYSGFAYLLLRLPLAMSMLGHGLARISKLNDFSQGMAAQFEATWLPQALVQPFAYFLPYLELNLGILLLLGLFTRVASAVGVGLMVALIFGSCLLENWDAVMTQMFYGLYFSLLVAFAYEHNRYSLDTLLHLRRERRKARAL